MIKLLYTALTASVIANPNPTFVNNSNVNVKDNSSVVYSSKDLKVEKHVVKSDVEVTCKKLKDNVEGFTGDLRIPVISGMRDEKIQSSINSSIEKDILDFAQNLKKDGIDFVEECKKIGVEPRDYFAITDYDVYQNYDNILSINVAYSEYTGGAHGMDYEKTYNIDLKTGKLLSLKDLFKDGSNYKDIINKEVSKQISQKNSVKDSYPVWGFESISEDQQFNIQNGNVIIVFQRGDIAPYCMGTLKFIIPLDNCKNILNNNFFK